jgi:ligand-binding sensor domain-containing protein
VRCLFQDKKGDLWFGNNGAGLFRYDGKTLTNFTEQKGLGDPTFLKDHRVADTKGTLARVWTITDDTVGNLWVGTIDAGLWKLGGDGLTNYTTADGLPGNAIWRLYTDRQGVLWVVTNGDAVCRFDGKTFARVAFD